MRAANQIGAGDRGDTSLTGGSRVRKHDPRVEAVGSIDEANSAIGLARAALEVAAEDEAQLDRMLDFVQHRLFNAAASLAGQGTDQEAGTPFVSNADVERLESFVDELESATDDVQGFVLPGGCEEAARLHVARAAVRRAERRAFALADAVPVDTEVLRFLNRLSTVLFAAARYANTVYGTGDIAWDPRR